MPTQLTPRACLPVHQTGGWWRLSAGLMRVLAWTLNGLELIAQNAIVRTTPEGMAKNTFWLSTISGEGNAGDFLTGGTYPHTGCFLCPAKQHLLAEHHLR
jgi:hypothetical protein